MTVTCRNAYAAYVKERNSGLTWGRKKKISTAAGSHTLTHSHTQTYSYIHILVCESQQPQY